MNIGEVKKAWHKETVSRSVLFFAFVLLTGCATIDEARVVDEGIQTSTSIEVVDNTGAVNEQAKTTIIEPVLREKLVPRVGGNKKIRVEVHQLEQTRDFTNVMSCLMGMPLLGAPYKSVWYTAEVRIWISDSNGVSVGPYKSKQTAREDGGLYQKIDPQKGKMNALRDAMDDVAYMAVKDEKKITTAFSKGPASARNSPADTLKRLHVDIDDIPDFGAQPRNQDIAIVIGIEKYRGLPASEFSTNDAHLVKEYLKALGFQESNIEYLTDNQATFVDIKKAVERWLPNRVHPDSNVFIYYSGHGAPDPATGEAYIVPFDGDPNYIADTGYSLKRLYGEVGKIRAGEVMVVLDSCFSGAGGRSVLAQNARPLVMTTDAPVLSSTMAVLSASQASQISTSSTEKQHGLFTYYFVKGLKNGKRTLSEIYTYMKPLVEDEAKSLNVMQTPSICPGPEKLAGRFAVRKQ
jgi:hypothetical protein